jgi:hypothetical protein
VAIEFPVTPREIKQHQKLVITKDGSIKVIKEEPKKPNYTHDSKSSARYKRLTRKIILAKNFSKHISKPVAKNLSIIDEKPEISQRSAGIEDAQKRRITTLNDIKAQLENIEFILNK